MSTFDGSDLVRMHRGKTQRSSQRQGGHALSELSMRSQNRATLKLEKGGKECANAWKRLLPTINNDRERITRAPRQDR